MKVIVLDRRPSEAELLFIQEGIDIHFKKQSTHERLTRWERLRALDISVGEIARQTGFSQGQVSRVLGLSRLCEEARAMLRVGCDLEKAFIASAIQDPAKQVELMKDAAHLTRDQFRRKVKGVEMRAHKAVFLLPGGIMIAVQRKQMTLKDAVETLLTLVKELRASMRAGMEITTCCRVLADKARAHQ
jgi:hypothetical protein